MHRKSYPKCTQCGSVPRNRSAWLLLEHNLTLGPGRKIAHFAPEKGIQIRLHKLLGDGYERYDLDPPRYAVPGLPPVRKMDLCTGLGALQAESYDAVIHNHVMEHLPCNETIILQRLHALLKPGGLHIFSVPLTSGYSRADLDPALTQTERTKRFFQHDHIRKFGRADFDMTLGMVFGLTREDYSLLNHVPRQKLEAAGIPPDTWTPDGSTVFLVRRGVAAHSTAEDGEEPASAGHRLAKAM